MFTAVAGLALAAGQGFRVVQVDVKYMKSEDYDIALARERIKTAKQSNLKFFFIAMTGADFGDADVHRFGERFFYRRGET